MNTEFSFPTVSLDEMLMQEKFDTFLQELLVGNFPYIQAYIPIRGGSMLVPEELLNMKKLRLS